MNSNWPRWIKASISSHFANLIGNANLIVVGERRYVDEKNDRFELKLNGPRVTNSTKNEYVLEYDVSLLIISTSNESNIYEMEDYKSIGINAFITSIPVYDNNDALVDCLTLKSDIVVRDFGFVSGTVYHVAIDAIYVFEKVDPQLYHETLTLGSTHSLEVSD